MTKVVGIKTTIGDSLIEMQVTGSIGELLSETSNPAEMVVEVWGKVLAAIEAVNNAKNYKQRGENGYPNAWIKAYALCNYIGLTTKDVEVLYETGFTVSVEEH